MLSCRRCKPYNVLKDTNIQLVWGIYSIIYIKRDDAIADLSLKDYAIVKNIEEHVTATVILQYLLFNMLRYLLGSLIKQKAREMHLSQLLFFLLFLFLHLFMSFEFWRQWSCFYSAWSCRFFNLYFRKCLTY